MNNYIISVDKSLLDIVAIHSLFSQTYWANDRSMDTITRSIENSICVGAYLDGKQVGFARVVTDYTTMYWLTDVIVDSNHRGKALGKKMVEIIINLDELLGCFGILATVDAHNLYERFGFVPEPIKFMRKNI